MIDDRELIPTRQTLLTRLKHVDNEASWKEFFDTYWRLIYSTAVRSGLTESEAQDVVQETVLSVVKSIPDFQYDPKAGSFKAWLLTLTRWRIIDQFRKRPPGAAHVRVEPASCRTATVERIADPSGERVAECWNEEWERNLTDVALDRVRQRVDPKQYQVFDLFVLKEWPAKKIARLLGMNRANVYLTKHRIMKLLEKEGRLLRKQHERRK